jgi:hypothetical protein
MIAAANPKIFLILQFLLLKIIPISRCHSFLSDKKKKNGEIVLHQFDCNIPRPFKYSG